MTARGKEGRTGGAEGKQVPLFFGGTSSWVCGKRETSRAGPLQELQGSPGELLRTLELGAEICVVILDLCFPSSSSVYVQTLIPMLSPPHLEYTERLLFS